jgi:NTE family protein
MLTRKMIERSHNRVAQRTPAVFGFYGVSQTPVRPFVDSVAQGLAELGHRVKILDKAFHGTASDAFNSIEAEHDYVLHVAEVHESHWRLLSTRQVDQVFLLADYDQLPDATQISGEVSSLHRAPDLILLYPPDLKKGSLKNRTKAYIDLIEPHRWFHCHRDAKPDAARIARTISGQSIGLVLSGGGARAFAHIGAIEALIDAKLPFDFIGGTSMGAIIGACLAHEWSFSELQARIRDAFVVSSPLDDISFPFLAMSSGRKVDERLTNNFGDVHIEDLPLPFYCVSSNLTDGNIKIHRTGLLRQALRASIALPGVIPPVIAEGQVLVDGGVMRSFPAGLMRHMHLGTVVGLDVTRAKGLDPKSLIVPKNLPQWIMGGDWRRGPPIVSILMRSATITTAADLAQARAATDFLVIPQPGTIEIRDFHAYDEAVTEGYRACAEALAQLEVPVGMLRKTGKHVHPNVPVFTLDDGPQNDYVTAGQKPKRKKPPKMVVKKAKSG